MHEKFSSQKGNKGNLLQEVRDAEARLEAVKAGQLRHEQTFQELRSSGTSVYKSSSSSSANSPRRLLTLPTTGPGSSALESPSAVTATGMYN